LEKHQKIVTLTQLNANLRKSGGQFGHMALKAI
jgi:hypothetical protein